MMNKYFLNENIFLQEFMDDDFALNMEKGDAFNLNSTAKMILEKMDQTPRTSVEIIRLLGGDSTEEYKKDLEVLESFLLEMVEIGIVEVRQNEIAS